MLVFLTSLRHPQTSKDFARVESLLETTLRSVRAQTDTGFRVVVVSNVKPRIALDHPSIHYHIVGFPPPCQPENRLALRRDKGVKLLAGMLAARRWNPSYFAILDSDDLVSRHLAKFANGRPSTPGWYVDSGYTLDHYTRRIQRKSGLYRFCGTSLIPNAAALLDLANTPSDLDEYSPYNQLLRKVSLTFIDRVLGDHSSFLTYFAKHRLRLQALPFAGAVWVLNTGENNSGRLPATTGLPIDQRFCREFGLCSQTTIESRASTSERFAESIAAGFSKLGSMRDKLFGHHVPR